jgi:hypothetical protein
VGYRRFYEGPPRERDKIAILTHRFPYSQTEIVATVDGQPAALAAVIELSPGRHGACIAFVQPAGGSGVLRSRGCVNIEFEALPGHVYEVYAIHRTHLSSWAPALRDVTSELGRKEKARLAQTIVDIANKNRPEGGARWPDPAPPAAAPALPGFGEPRTASIAGAGGKAVTITYKFDRYAPFVQAEGSDGKTYHVEVSPVSGDVVRVFGTHATVGSFFSGAGISGAFQPLGSDTAYILDIDDEIIGAYKEGPPGTYTKVEGPLPKRLPATP